MDAVLEIIERGNQRGGRALSVIDLLQAETLSLRQIAWLLARIEQGSSWVVGAKPGGAGKTTIMSALLAMLPEGGAIRLASPGTGWEESRPGDCVVAYEIGPGHYEAYVWGEDVGRLTRMAAKGCRVVTNLHADTLEEAREQIVGDCGANPADFAGLGIFVPICVGREAGGVRRTVPAIHAAEAGAWREFGADLSSSGREDEIAGFIEACAGRGVCRVEDVRAAWLDWRVRHPLSAQNPQLLDRPATRRLE